MAKNKIDYKHWASLDKWSQKETVLLMCGMNPDEHKEVRLTGKNLPPIYEEAAALARVLSRIDWQARYGVSAYEVGGNPVYVVHALMATGSEPPKGLTDALAERQKRDQEFRDQIEERRPDPAHSGGTADDGGTDGNMSRITRERKTMLKLILGFACGGYGMLPDDEKNQHARVMRIDLEKLGMPLDDGTIKKYLDEARALRRSIMATTGPK